MTMRLTQAQFARETNDALIPHGWDCLDPMPSIPMPSINTATRYDCESAGQSLPAPTEYPPPVPISDDAGADVAALCIALWGMGELLPARSRARAKRRAAKN